MCAAALLAVLPAQALAEDFVCRGRDPGWELVGRGDQATFLPEKGSSRSFSGAASELPAEGVVVWRGRTGAGQPDLVAVMLRGACTDPMAEAVSTYLGIVSLPDAGSSVGCCSYGAPAVAALPPVAADEAQGEGDAEPAEAAPSEAAAPPAPQLKAGATARVAGSSRESVNLRARPGNGRVIGKLAGGRSVVIQQSSQHDGYTWYRVRGRGVPRNAWVRGDLLRGG